MSGQIVFLGSLDPRLHPPPSPKTSVKYKVEAVAGTRLECGMLSHSTLKSTPSYQLIASLPGTQ